MISCRSHRANPRPAHSCTPGHDLTSGAVSNRRSSCAASAQRVGERLGLFASVCGGGTGRSREPNTFQMAAVNWRDQLRKGKCLEGLAPGWPNAYDSTMKKSWVAGGRKGPGGAPSVGRYTLGETQTTFHTVRHRSRSRDQCGEQSSGGRQELCSTDEVIGCGAGCY